MGIYYHVVMSLISVLMYFSFHNKLKTTYLNGKVNKRIDFLLDVLLRVERDNFKYMEKEILLEQQCYLYCLLYSQSLPREKACYIYHCTGHDITAL